MNIVYMGGQKVGAECLKHIKKKHKVLATVGYTRHVKGKYKSIKNKGFIKAFRFADALLCVHGREIVPKWMLKKSINVHPFLLNYPGKDPIGRALKDGKDLAHVASHHMTETVDSGPIIWIEYEDIAGLKTRRGIYNRLISTYKIVADRTLNKVLMGGWKMTNLIKGRANG